MDEVRNLRVICPHCQSDRTIRKGTLPTGAIRFECKSCGRKFRSVYVTPEQQSETNRENGAKADRSRRIDQWQYDRVLQLKSQGLPVGIIAKRMGISRSTVGRYLKHAKE